MNFITILKALAVPFALLSILLLFALFYELLGLPSSDELLRLSRSYLQAYGYWIVFVAALIETIPPINLYLPGSAVVVLSVAYAREGDLNIWALLSLVSLAFVLAYWIDYLIGNWGWYRLLERVGLRRSLADTRSRLEQHGLSWLWLACIHPNLGALAATSCGILNVQPTRFLRHISSATVLWVGLWGSAAYWGGDLVFGLANLNWLIAAICTWILFRVIFLLRRRHENHNK